MSAIKQRTPNDQHEVSAPSALAYETTEEARLLLGGLGGELGKAETAAAEAAYYLSDTIEPDDRIGLLAFAEGRNEPSASREDDRRAIDALTLLADVAVEVEDLLRGPDASSELRIALRALRSAIGVLADHFKLAANHLDVDGVRTQRLRVLRMLHARPR
jgi:hypothetical protein